MGLEFIDRVKRTAIVTGAVIGLVLWAHYGGWAAAGFASGLAWSLVNLHLLRLLAAGLTEGAGKLRMGSLLALKLPVLYVAGYLLLASGRLPVSALLAGFGWPLLVIVLKAAGRLVLGLDRGRRSAGGADLVDERRAK